MKKTPTDIVDHILVVFIILFLFMCLVVISETAKAHHLNRTATALPQWEPPAIPYCDKELWLRIVDGCHTNAKGE